MDVAASTSGLIHAQRHQRSARCRSAATDRGAGQIVAEVAEKLSQIEAADVAIDHGLARAARLRQSILKRAFAGQLVPQDTHDEPATALLERIARDSPAEGTRGRDSRRGKAPTARKPARMEMGN